MNYFYKKVEMQDNKLSFITVTILTIVTSTFVLLTSQLVIHPILAGRVETNYYGQILTLVGIVSVLV